jgi:hypothetical protein
VCRGSPQHRATARAKGDEVWALALLGQVASSGRHADPEAATGYLLEAIGKATALEMRPATARCHLHLGTMSMRFVRREEAEAHLRTAATQLAELQMQWWLAEFGKLFTVPPGRI